MLAAIPLTVQAQWTGFPFAVNTSADTYDWATVNSTYNPIFQLYTAICERCVVSGIATPRNIETWNLYAGTNLYVFAETNIIPGATNIYWYTNIIVASTNITTTNASYFGPFAYTYTNGGGTHTSTGYPYLTQAALAVFDTKIKALYASGNWISTNFAQFLYVTGRYGPTDYPEFGDFDESFAGALYYENIGAVTNITTNDFGFITGGTANFTRYPEQTNKFLLAESSFTTNGVWLFNKIATNEAYRYDQTMPHVYYYAAGTNPFENLTVTLTGLILTNPATQKLASGSEVVSVTESNGVDLTNLWWSVTNIACTAPANTGDTLAVQYTGTFPIYGDWPFELYAKDLDERQLAINRLRMYHIYNNSPIRRKIVSLNHTNWIGPQYVQTNDNLWLTFRQEIIDGYDPTIGQWATTWTTNQIGGGDIYNFYTYFYTSYQTNNITPIGNASYDMWAGNTYVNRVKYLVTNMPYASIPRELMLYVKTRNVENGYDLPFVNFLGLQPTNIIERWAFYLYTNSPSFTGANYTIEERFVNAGNSIVTNPLTLPLSGNLYIQSGAQTIFDEQFVIKWDFNYK